MSYLSVRKIIIRLERRVQRSNQIEESFSADGVAKGSIFIPGNAARVAPGAEALGRGEGLQIVRIHTLISIKALVHRFITPRHLTRVGLNSSKNLAIPCLDTKGIVDVLKPTALQQLHD